MEPAMQFLQSVPPELAWHLAEREKTGAELADDYMLAIKEGE